MTGQQMFRAEALEKISSPEQLDQLMPAIRPRSWFYLAVLGVLLAITVLWGSFGSIPETVSGRGVLVFPRQVVTLQASASGQVISVEVAPGSWVEKGAVLARIERSGLAQDLADSEARLAELESSTESERVLLEERLRVERASIAFRRQLVETAIERLQGLADSLKAESLAAIEGEEDQIEEQVSSQQSIAERIRQRQTESILARREQISRQLADARQLADVLQKELESERRLGEKVGAVSSRDVRAALQAYLAQAGAVMQLQKSFDDLAVEEIDVENSHQDRLTRIATLERQKRDMARRRIETQQDYVAQIQKVEELQSELRGMDVEEKELELEESRSRAKRTVEIQDLRQRIERLRAQYEAEGKIVSEQAGKILELPVSPGQVVAAGSRIGLLETARSGSELSNVSFLTVGDAKRARLGMKVLITPDTVKRERFGGILGEVAEASTFPTTAEEAASVVGSSDLASLLVSEGRVILVHCRLETSGETPSGYAWSSSTGPDMRLSAATTTTVQIVVERRRPISYVLPFLRELTGVE